MATYVVSLKAYFEEAFCPAAEGVHVSLDHVEAPRAIFRHLVLLASDSRGRGPWRVPTTSDVVGFLVAANMATDLSLAHGVIFYGRIAKERLMVGVC